MRQVFPCSHLLLIAFHKKKRFISLDLMHVFGFIVSSSLWSLFCSYEAALALSIAIVVGQYLPVQRFLDSVDGFKFNQIVWSCLSLQPFRWKTATHDVCNSSWSMVFIYKKSRFPLCSFWADLIEQPLKLALGLWGLLSVSSVFFVSSKQDKLNIQHRLLRNVLHSLNRSGQNLSHLAYKAWEVKHYPARSGGCRSPAGNAIN